MIRKFSAVKPELCDIGFQHSRNLIFPQSIAGLQQDFGVFVAEGYADPAGFCRLRPLFPRLSLLFSFFPFRATQAYCNPPDKAITKTNNLSVKAGSTNVTTNKGYVGVILLSTGNQGSPSSPSEWLLPAVVWAGKAQL